MTVKLGLVDNRLAERKAIAKNETNLF